MASLEYLFVAFAESTGRQPIGLLTLSHAAFPGGTLRYCTGHEIVLSRGNGFAPLWYTVRFPTVSDAGVRPGELVLDNTGEEPIGSLRSATGPVSVLFEMVLANTAADPDAVDRVEIPARWFIRPEASYTGTEIRARLGFSNVLADAFPQRKFTPNEWRGVF
jgi:hypothetical protein